MSDYVFLTASGFYSILPEPLAGGEKSYFIVRMSSHDPGQDTAIGALIELRQVP